MTITEILTKLNLNFEDLNASEKETYQNWEETLRGKEITIDVLKEFIKSQIEIIIDNIAVPNISKNEEDILKAQVRNYKTLLAFINYPERSKAFLENHLNNLFRK